MRVIKFRAWYFTYNKMYYNIMIGELADGANTVPVILHNGERVNLWGDNEHGAIMQFTGLLDKDGKEGYADDLVEMFDRSLFGIAWDEYHACFRLKLVQGDEIQKVHDMDMLQFSRIIGNIYDNPELLGIQSP